MEPDLYDYYYDEIETRIIDNDYATHLTISMNDIRKCGYSSRTEFEEDVILLIISSLVKKYHKDFEILQQKLSNCIKYV